MDENFNGGHEELTRTIEPEVIRMGLFARVIGIFISPGDLMRNIKAYPVAWVPLLLIVLVSLLTMPFTLAIQDLMNRELSYISIERYGFDLTDIGGMGVDFYGEGDLAALTNAVVTVGTVVGVVVVTPIVCFLAALGLWILCKIFRGSATLVQMFSMYLHIYVLATVGGLISAWLMSATGNFLDMTSLAAVLMPTGNITQLPFNILSAISIFTIWSTVLTYIGVKIINDFSDVKAGVIAFISFVASVVIYAGTMMSTFIIWDLTMNMM